jgi:hypothetical protein
MIFDTSDGEGMVLVTPRHKDVVDDLIRRLRDQGMTIGNIAKVLNRSPRDIYRKLKAIRERETIRDMIEAIPFLGANPYWDPEVERQATRRAAPCRRCGGEIGPIQDGSPFVCLACLHSGLDDLLRAEMAAERARHRAQRAARDRDTPSFAARHCGRRANHD